MTDADLFLGHLADGAAARRRGHARPRGRGARARAAGRAARAGRARGGGGHRAVADAEMARALRVISVERGLDPREFALVAFGGAGGMHACALAEELGMRDRPGAARDPACSARSGWPCPTCAATTCARARRARRSSTRRRSSGVRRARGAPARTSRTRGSSAAATCATAASRSSSTSPPTTAAALAGASTPRTSAATATGWTASRWRLVALRVVATVAGREARSCSRTGAPRATPEPGGARRASTASGAEVAGATTAALGAGHARRGPAVVEFAEATSSCAPAGRARWTGRARSSAARERLVSGERRPSARPRRPLGALASALGGHRRGDGRGAGARRLLLEHQGASRLLGGAVRRRGRMVAQAEHIPVHLGAMPRGGRGGARARPAAGRRPRRSTTRSAAARTCPT